MPDSFVRREGAGGGPAQHGHGGAHVAPHGARRVRAQPPACQVRAAAEKCQPEVFDLGVAEHGLQDAVHALAEVAQLEFESTS